MIEVNSNLWELNIWKPYGYCTVNDCDPLRLVNELASHFYGVLNRGIGIGDMTTIGQNWGNID